MTRPLSETRFTPQLAAFRRFAALSGDHNPIHTDPDFAATSRFGAPVCHGMLLWSALDALARRCGLPLPRALTLSFGAPAFAAEPLHLCLVQTPRGLSGEGLRADGASVIRLIAEDPAPPEAPLTPAAGPEAELSRSFSPADLQAWAQLTGAPLPETVPDPLIGALFSCLLGTRLPGPGTGWLRQRLHIFATARSDEPLTARVRFIAQRPRNGLCELDCSAFGQEGRLIAAGRALMLPPPAFSLQSAVNG